MTVILSAKNVSGSLIGSRGWLP